MVISFQITFLNFFIFLVTIDYKVLLLLLVKINNEEFVLGGRGLLVEFCFVCDAIRGRLKIQSSHK